MQHRGESSSYAQMRAACPQKTNACQTQMKSTGGNTIASFPPRSPNRRIPPHTVPRKCTARSDRRAEAEVGNAAHLRPRRDPRALTSARAAPPLPRSRASVDPLPLLHRCRPGLPALFSLADGACSSLLARTFSGEIPPVARGERK